MKVSLRGLAGVKKQLRAIATDTRPRVLRAAMRAAFKPVLEAARAKVPVDSGELREALAIASASGRGDTSGAVGIVVLSNSKRSKQARIAAAAFGEAQTKSVPPSRRWHFIELGTARRGAQPFLRPALDENAQRVVDALGREVEKRVKRQAKRGGK